MLNANCSIPSFSANKQNSLKYKQLEKICDNTPMHIGSLSSDNNAQIWLVNDENHKSSKVYLKKHGESRFPLLTVSAKTKEDAQKLLAQQIHYGDKIILKSDSGNSNQVREIKIKHKTADNPFISTTIRV